MFLSVAPLSSPDSLNSPGFFANPLDTLFSPTAIASTELPRPPTSPSLSSTALPEVAVGDVVWVGVLGPS